ncbi:CapA family protein [Patescibacteria group bacterium]|nr:CapA family protein [Patescibacteria group bacterium]
MKRALIGTAVIIGALALAYGLAVSSERIGTVIAIPAPLAPTPKEATILFAGDAMFDRTVRLTAERYGEDYLFDCIDPTLKSADLVILNLEGPITEAESVSVGSVPEGIGNYTFTFPISTGPLLAKHGIDIVNLGNNHILDFGSAGTISTMELLSEAGVQYFGDPLTHSVARKDVGGVSLSFINYNEFVAHAQAASTTLSQVRAEAAAGRLPVVYTHWGVEYATSTPGYIVTLAHQFVDAGAVAVIGSHPHVVGESELYKDAPIYYSLGNFIFDQYFSYETTHGLMVAITFSNGRAKNIREIPIEIHRNQVCPSVTN